MKNEIKTLYKSLKDKIGFCEANAETFGIKPITMYTTWLSGFWLVPVKHYQEIKDLLIAAIAKQEESKQLEAESHE